MIELKNVSKTYKSKKGKSTKALDDVSITFAKKGMTFILGKSGSGKSTLLNLLGGLDKYDSGDILFLGKSSKNFKYEDFDSYRNTYVGFIFQEFNLLEDYDVYENIILALQIQQKEIKEKEIDDLLEKLELKDLKLRKVNELSGGQKQRVAIARALIKDPKIILADEPTGNLDSETGTQVMELLKKASKEKLVIVVTHDEEYAKEYGDRIIEIKDGKVVNDTKPFKQDKNNNTYQTIKSHLPFKDGFKLGFGSLKHKKFKLGLTIFLTILTLGFLSCADTLSSFNFDVSHASILTKNKEEFIEIEKKYVFKNSYGYEEMVHLPMDDDSIKKINNKINKTPYDVYKYYDNSGFSDASSIISLLHINVNEYYSTSSEIVVADDLSKILKEELIGKYPSKDNEIVISNYVADLMIKKGVEVHETVVKTEFKTSNIFNPKNYDDILNTKYNYYFGSSDKVKIVGIINYDLKDASNDYKENVLYKIFVNEDFMKNRKNKKTNSLRSSVELEVLVDEFEIKDDEDSMAPSFYSVPLNKKLEYFDGKSWKTTNSLKDNEIILNISYLNYNDENYYSDLTRYLNSNYGDYDVLQKRFIANYINEKNIIGKKANLKIYYALFDRELIKEYKDFTVVGVYFSNEGYEYNCFANSILENYVQMQYERSSVLYPMTLEEDFKETSSSFPVNSNLAIKSTYSNTLYQEKAILDAMKTLAFYASIVLLVFTVFLIANFIFTSINYRKKEIGILRALGARSSDIISIFLWEGFTLSIISGTISSILLVIVSNYLNSYIAKEIGMLTTPFMVGIRQFVFIYLVVIIVTLIASILPIIKISKMKPIDAILNK